MIIQEDLILLGKLRLRWGNSYIDVLDSEGNLNARVKNIIKSGRPNSNSNDGFYCDGSKTYIKFGSQIFTIGGISESNLPSGSILMYLGSTPPDGWYEYERPTGLNDTIYIINKLGTTPEKISVLLLWIYNGSPTNLVNAKLGLNNDFPSLSVSPSAANGTRTYSSSNTSVATINNSGNVNIRNVGTTIITCLMEETSLYKGASASYTLNVSLDKEEVTLDWTGSVETMGTLSIILNESFTTPVIEVNGTSLNQKLFKLNYVNYTSFNTNVATVSKSSSGDLILNPVGVGTSVIMARCEDSDDHTENTSIFTLEVSERLKIDVILSSGNYTINNDNETFTPTIGITGGSLDNVYIEIVSDSNNIISSISNRTLNLTGNTGQATLRAIYPEDSTHNPASITFRLTVESELTVEQFDSLNTIISNLNSSGISPQIPNSGAVYTYLLDMYSKGIDEFDNNTIGLFSESTYPEATEGNSSEFLSLGYRGNNNTFALDGTSKNIMLYWLIATCVAELIPTSGTNTNNQTKLFKTAYDLGKGNDYGQRIPLYNNYTVKADPSIARLAATELYTYYYEEESSSRNSAKTTLNGLSISGSTWDDLGTNADISSVTTILGWIVDTDKIIPAAPGDRISGYNTGFSDFTSKLTGLDSDGNYDVDVAIDDYVTKYYNLYVGDSDDVTDDFNKFKSQSSSVKERVLEAAMIPGSNNYMYFGRKTVRISEPTRKSLTNTSYTEMSSGATYYYHKYNFELANSPDNNTIFDIKSAFYNWENKMFSGTYSQTGAMNCMAELMSIADNSRFPTMGNQYGRRRPLGGITFRDSTRSGYYTTPTECLHHPLAGLQCGNLMKFFADTSARASSFADDSYDDFPHDRANSYPSGHSAQAWIIAMLLSLYDNSTTISNIIGGYRMGVNRSIGRYHWNSDVIYGRLCACMILPIINSMTGGYTKLKSLLNNGSSGGGGSASMTPCSNEGGGSSQTISTNPININIHNNSSTAFTFYYVTFGFTDGEETGGIDGTMGTVAAGQTVSFNNIILDEVKQSKLGKILSTPSIRLTDYTYLQFNNFSGQMFNGGLTYDIYYGDSTPSTTSGGGSSGGNCNLSNITITNNTGNSITIDLINFLLSNNDRCGRINITYNNGLNSITLANGSSCTGTFDASSASYYGLYTFRNMSSSIEINGDIYTSNVILYNNGVAQFYNYGLALDSTKTFTNGTYQLTIGGSSGGGGGDTPTPSGDWDANLYIINLTGKSILWTGESRVYISDGTGFNIKMPNALHSETNFTINSGTNDFSSYSTSVKVNDGADDTTYPMLDSYNGQSLTRGRIYLRGSNVPIIENGIDTGGTYSGIVASTDIPGFTITFDSTGDTVLKKSGGTYKLVLNCSNPLYIA